MIYHVCGQESGIELDAFQSKSQQIFMCVVIYRTRRVSWF